MIQIKQSHTVAASEKAVEAALLDPAVLKEAIPGSTAVRKIGEMMFWGAATVGILRFRFDLDATIEAKPSPDGFHFKGDVRAGTVKVGKLDMKLSLHEQDGATRIDSVADLRPARPYGKVVTAAAKVVANKLLRSFFQRFGDAIAGER